MRDDTPWKRPRPIAGTPGDFAVVSHLVVSGSHAEIGSGLARAAIHAYGSAPRPIMPTLGRARQRWFEANWPEHHERCQGMAAAFGVTAGDPSLCVDELNGFPLPGGCSAVWSPPTPAVPAMVVRNFDIHASVIDTAPVRQAGQRLPALARPYVVEMRPDRGLSSVAITGNNLSGCLEGINEAGLCVVELADGQDDSISPTASPQAGLDESQLPRFLLDRCRTAAQAREALHEAKHYTRYSSCHFLIADAQGDAFVWEREGDNVEHIIDAEQAPLIITNHLLSRDAAPAEEEVSGTRTRDGLLAQQLAHGDLNAARLHAALDSVRAEPTVASGSSTATAVTLWRTEYEPARSTMTVRFLLSAEGGRRYSMPLSIALR
ncbi:C45 family autoproteolytic acyltransferase/hydolase [Micromonospora echinospora]|uniref:C45 family autoproteolytic acyltransferase/hydolase n=1 Tax=Micromonospora echinospora TaxID=1877 RepID=UPI003A847289